MSSYPAYLNALQILANLQEALKKTEGERRERIEKLIKMLDEIKDNRTFMRTQKAEKITQVCLGNSEALKENPADEEKFAALENDIKLLVEKVRSMVIRMT